MHMKCTNDIIYEYSSIEESTLLRTIESNSEVILKVRVKVSQKSRF